MRDGRPRKTIVREVFEVSVRNFARHRMTTYAAALAYRALFGLLPLVFLVVALLVLLCFDAFFNVLIEEVESTPQQETPEPLHNVVERLVEQVARQASGGLVSLGAVVGLWSVYALARTLVEALNAAHGVQETRPGWKRVLISLAFGPFLAFVVIAATGLMSIGPRLIGSLIEPKA